MPLLAVTDPDTINLPGYMTHNSLTTRVDLFRCRGEDVGKLPGFLAIRQVGASNVAIKRERKVLDLLLEFLELILNVNEGSVHRPRAS